MPVRVGDAVFIRSGIPATVKARDDTSGQLTLESDTAKVQNDMRHGYLNGLSPESRKQLYDILDEVKENSTQPGDRVEAMRQRLEELQKDPRNLTVSRYLQAEMVHLMNTYSIRPKEYSIHESKAR